MRATVLLSLFAAGLLAGCANTASEPLPQAVTVQSPPPAPALRKANAIPAVQQSELIGKTGKALKSLMGPPTLLRRDHGAEVWQYAGQSCVLFAYLYADGKGNAAQVSYLDARSKKSGTVPVPDCLAELARDGADKPTS